MKPQKQLFRRKPEDEIYGDCYRTAIACLLEIEPASVPHFYDEGRGSKEVDSMVREWLWERGMDTLLLPYKADLQVGPSSVAALNPNIFYMLSGTSRTGCNHVVICQNREIVWDPSLDDSGIVGPCDDGYYWLEFLVLHDFSLIPGLSEVAA